MNKLICFLLLWFITTPLYAQTLNVNVTPSDINNGDRKSTTMCAIAKAILRDYNIKSEVRYFDIMINGKVITLPDIARNFIIHWDINKPTNPFRFTIEI